MRTFGAGPTIERILDLDSTPLDQARPQEERLIGYCYHFALVHCALLRAKGVPSRTRCGFANYLTDGKWTDHWVAEYWDGNEWLLNDPQIGLDQLSHEDFRDWCDLLRVEPLDQPHPEVDAHLDSVANLVAPGTPMAELHTVFGRDASIRPPDEVIRGATTT